MADFPNLPEDQLREQLKIENDRQLISDILSSFKNSLVQGGTKLGAAAADVGTLPIRGVMGAANTLLRIPRAAGLNIPFIPEAAFGGSSTSMTPYYDGLVRRDEPAPEPKGVADKPAAKTEPKRDESAKAADAVKAASKAAPAAKPATALQNLEAKLTKKEAAPSRADALGKEQEDLIAAATALEKNVSEIKKKQAEGIELTNEEERIKAHYDELKGRKFKDTSTMYDRAREWVLANGQPLYQQPGYGRAGGVNFGGGLQGIIAGRNKREGDFNKETELLKEAFTAMSKGRATDTARKDAKKTAVDAAELYDAGVPIGAIAAMSKNKQASFKNVLDEDTLGVQREGNDIRREQIASGERISANQIAAGERNAQARLAALTNNALLRGQKTLKPAQPNAAVLEYIDKRTAELMQATAGNKSTALTPQAARARAIAEVDKVYSGWRGATQDDDDAPALNIQLQD